MSKMGDWGFAAYLHATIQHDDRYDVYYDVEGTFTDKTLKKIQEKATSRTKVLILPLYFQMSPAFQRGFLRLMRTKTHTFISIIIMEPEFLEHPEKFFPDTNVPMEVILTRKPFSKELTSELIDIRCQLENNTITEKQKAQIYNLSGGHIGLTKRLCLLIFQGKKLSLQDALLDPVIKNDLLRLELQYRILAPDTLKILGILREDGSHTIPLLREFIAAINGNFVDTLSPMYQKLLSLFLTKPGDLVTKEEVHQILSDNKSYSLWAVYKNMSRFAKAVNAKYLIKTVSGKGYILLERKKDAHV